MFPPRTLLLLGLVTLTTACGGTPPEDTQPLPASEESSSESQPSAELLDRVASISERGGPNLQAQTCLSDCDAQYAACHQMCDEMYPPPYEYDDPYMYCMSQNCDPEYNSCRSSSIVYKARGTTICHLDKDQYVFGGIEIEFYTVDLYGEENVCNGTGTWYKKRRVAKVDCNYWTAMTDESECANRVENKFQELAGQGYYPTVSDVDIDNCPYPRL